MSELVVTQAHRGKAITANLGDVVVIRLSENPTTGFRWAFEDSQRVVTLESDGFVPNGGGAMGEGGVRTLRFRVTSGGRADLHFRLSRGWEPVGKDIERFDFTVNAVV